MDLRIFYLRCFLLSCFIFYVSTCWLSILSKAETYDFYVSFLVSMFHSKKHWGRKTKTLWKRFKNTVGAIQKHWGSDNALPQRFEKWNMKLKMKHPSQMFHFSKWLIFNYFIAKSETWKINQRFWKRMDICLGNLQFVCLIGGAGFQPAAAACLALSLLIVA